MIVSQKISLANLRSFFRGLDSHDDRETAVIRIIERDTDVTMTFACGNDNVVLGFRKAESHDAR